MYSDVSYVFYNYWKLGLRMSVSNLAMEGLYKLIILFRLSSLVFIEILLEKEMIWIIM